MVSTRQMTVTGGSAIEDGPVDGGPAPTANPVVAVNHPAVQPQPPPSPPNDNEPAGGAAANDADAHNDAMMMDDDSEQVAAALRTVRQLSASAMVIIDATSRALNAGLSMPVTVSRPRYRKSLHLFDMPVEILDKICSYVGYKKVAQIRVVSRAMNAVCCAALNSTFQRLQTRLQNRTKEIKCIMPRRESSRQIHPLRVECDIVDTCYMRLSLLQMTFGKHIDRKHICFFAGAVLDEVYNTLRQIKSAPTIRPHTMTEELYDLSTMAMEYFKEHLEPQLPTLVNFNRDFIDYHLSKNNLKTKYLLDTPTSSGRKSAANSPAGSAGSANSSALSAHSSSTYPSPPQSNMVLRKGIRKIKQGMKRYNNQLTVLRNDLRFCKRKSTEQAKHIGEMQKLLAETQKQVLEYAARLDENDKKNEEMSMKISTLLQESNKCKNELQYWRSINAPSAPGGEPADAASPQHMVDGGVQPIASVEGNDSWALAAQMVDDNSGSNNITTNTTDATTTTTTTTTIDGLRNALDVVEVPISVICSVGQPAKSVAGIKRKASAEPVVEVDRSSSSNYSAMIVGSSLISESTMAPSSSMAVNAAAPSIGSDIIKKARRVQNKAKCPTYNNSSSNVTTSNTSSLSSSSTVGNGKVTTRNK